MLKKLINKKTYTLLIIVLLSIFLRVFKLNDNPPSLFGDELDVGLHAYSIIQTGKDYLSNNIPVMFHSFAEFRLPLQIYSAVPFIKIFGLSEWGVRLPAALFGVLSVISFYFLAKELFNKQVALISTLFLAISPWHLQLTRQANDSGFTLPFVFIGILFFIKGLKDHRLLIISAASFALSFYSYYVLTVFTPLIALVLILLYRKPVLRERKRLFIPAIVFLLIVAPYINASLKKVSTKRYSDISISSNEEIIANVIKDRTWSDTFITRFYYNKYSIWLERFRDNYLGTFSTQFLFFEGDPNMRHSVGRMGMLYHFDLILLVLGVVAIVKDTSSKNKYSKSYYLILLWLVLAPIASSLTEEGGTHAARLLITLPPLIMISALGLDSFLKAGKKKYIRILLFVFIVVSLIDVTRYIHRYWVNFPKESWRFWQTGFKETINYVESIDENYERIYFNNTYEPSLQRFLFWYEYDMEKFQQQFEDDKHIRGLMVGFNGFKLGEKYYFGEIVKPVERLVEDKHLIVASAQDDITNPDILKNKGINLLNTFYSPDHLPLFYVFTKSSE